MTAIPVHVVTGDITRMSVDAIAVVVCRAFLRESSSLKELRLVAFSGRAAEVITAASRKRTS